MADNPQYSFGPLTDIDLTAAHITAWAVGGNNRLAQLQDNHGRRFALKLYAPSAANAWPRLQTEFHALALLQTCGITDVPEPIAGSEAGNLAVYSWLKGDPVKAVTPRHFDAALLLLRQLHALSETPGAVDWPEAAKASAACHTLNDIFTEITLRLAQFDSAAAANPDVEAFLTQRLVPLYQRLRGAAEQRYAAAGISEDWVPPLMLSPSDFGFHNCLETADGGISFLDFEYFGWDDPVKLAADFLHHPGHMLPETVKSAATAAFADLFSSNDPTWQERFRGAYPLYGVVWCLILLNEFRHDGLARRRHAGGGFAVQDRLDRQFSRARELCQRLEVENDLAA